MRDPRIYQISALSLLLLYGMIALDFDVGLTRATAIIATALATQYLCTRLFALPWFDSRSALISALSLCLLLRTNFLILALMAAVLTIASKFLLRWNGKHVFNPTNFGIVALLLLTDKIWVSPGQWGSTAFFGFLFACLGTVVVTRAVRADVTFAFLGLFAAILFGRALWLGDPLAIPLHRLENGALLLFAFFMISDPKTTPDSRIGRILFAALVAAGAAWLQIKWIRTADALLWSLAAMSVLTPIIDRLLPGGRYDWGRPTTGDFGFRILDFGLVAPVTESKIQNPKLFMEEFR